MMNTESQAKVHFGLANRRLQPLGHLSNGRNPYSSSVSGSNGRCDSGDSADSSDSSEVAKEITGPSPAKRLSGQQDPEKPAQGAASRRRQPPAEGQGRRSQKESQLEGGGSAGDQPPGALLYINRIYSAADDELVRIDVKQGPKVLFRVEVPIADFAKAVMGQITACNIIAGAHR